MSSKLQDELEARRAKTRATKPEFMAEVDALVKAAKAFGEGAEAIEVGKKAPEFQLPNAQGQTVSLTGLLAKGPAVVMFYRGSWCPYCNLQIRALQARLADIHACGAELVAISPESPDGSLSMVERDALEFPVLSDKGADVAARFGVAWKVPEPLLEHIRKGRNLDLAEINQGNANVLPIPATFVVNRDGVVAWRFLDVDYRTRPEPGDVLAALEELTQGANKT